MYYVNQYFLPKMIGEKRAAAAAAATATSKYEFADDADADVEEKLISRTSDDSSEDVSTHRHTHRQTHNHNDYNDDDDQCDEDSSISNSSFGSEGLSLHSGEAELLMFQDSQPETWLEMHWQRIQRETERQQQQATLSHSQENIPQLFRSSAKNERSRGGLRDRGGDRDSNHHLRWRKWSARRALYGKPPTTVVEEGEAEAEREIESNAQQQDVSRKVKRIRYAAIETVDIGRLVGEISMLRPDYTVKFKSIHGLGVNWMIYKGKVYVQSFSPIVVYENKSIEESGYIVGPVESSQIVCIGDELIQVNDAVFRTMESMQIGDVVQRIDQWANSSDGVNLVFQYAENMEEFQELLSRMEREDADRQLNRYAGNGSGIFPILFTDNVFERRNIFDNHYSSSSNIKVVPWRDRMAPLITRSHPYPSIARVSLMPVDNPDICENAVLIMAKELDKYRMSTYLDGYSSMFNRFDSLLIRTPKMVQILRCKQMQDVFSTDGVYSEAKDQIWESLNQLCNHFRDHLMEIQYFPDDCDNPSWCLRVQQRRNKLTEAPRLVDHNTKRPKIVAFSMKSLQTEQGKIDPSGSSSKRNVICASTSLLQDRRMKHLFRRHFVSPYHDFVQQLLIPHAAPMVPSVWSLKQLVQRLDEYHMMLRNSSVPSPLFNVLHCDSQKPLTLPPIDITYYIFYTFFHLRAALLVDDTLLMAITILEKWLAMFESSSIFEVKLWRFQSCYHETVKRFNEERPEGFSTASELRSAFANQWTSALDPINISSEVPTETPFIVTFSHDIETKYALNDYLKVVTDLSTLLPFLKYHALCDGILQPMPNYECGHEPNTAAHQVPLKFYMLPFIINQSHGDRHISNRETDDEQREEHSIMEASLINLITLHFGILHTDCLLYICQQLSCPLATQMLNRLFQQYWSYPIVLAASNEVNGNSQRSPNNNRYEEESLIMNDSLSPHQWLCYFQRLFFARYSFSRQEHFFSLLVALCPPLMRYGNQHLAIELLVQFLYPVISPMTVKVVILKLNSSSREQDEGKKKVWYEYLSNLLRNQKQSINETCPRNELGLRGGSAEETFHANFNTSDLSWDVVNEWLLLSLQLAHNLTMHNEGKSSTSAISATSLSSRRRFKSKLTLHGESNLNNDSCSANLIHSYLICAHAITRPNTEYPHDRMAAFESCLRYSYHEGLFQTMEAWSLGEGQAIYASQYEDLISEFGKAIVSKTIRHLMSVSVSPGNEVESEWRRFLLILCNISTMYDWFPVTSIVINIIETIHTIFKTQFDMESETMTSISLSQQEDMLQSCAETLFSEVATVFGKHFVQKLMTSSVRSDSFDAFASLLSVSFYMSIR